MYVNNEEKYGDKRIHSSHNQSLNKKSKKKIMQDYFDSKKDTFDILVEMEENCKEKFR